MATPNETEIVFDRSIGEMLRQQYAHALGEPLPEHLLRLLDAVNPPPAPSGK